MVSSLSKAVGRWETGGEAAREEQGAGSGAREPWGYRGRLATWSKTGWELENFFPWVEMPPLHFEGIEQTRGHREARSRKDVLIGGFYGRLMQ